MSEYDKDQIIKLRERLAKSKRDSNAERLATQLYRTKYSRDDWKEKCLIARKERDEAKLAIKKIQRIIEGI